MKGALTVLTMLGLLLLAASAIAAETKEPKPIHVSDKQTVKVTVEAIDHDNRTLTVKGPKGKVITFTVDEAVERFDAIKVGDEITAKYLESVALEVRKPGQEPASDSVTAGAAKLAGEKPAGAFATQTTTTVTIEAIDPVTPAVTVRTSDGRSVSFRVKKKKYLENVAVGDKVVITYTEALLIETEGAK